jgi:thymidylate synthase ThyX
MVGRACSPTSKSVHADEEAILRRYVTNLHLPVFALVNLPEVVKGALFARYSRSPKSLRRLFLDEFVGDLDISGDISLDATVGLEAGRAALREGLRRIRRRFGGPARRRAPGLRAVLQRALQGARVGTPHGLPRAVDALHRVRQPTGERALPLPPAEPKSSTRPYGARYVGDMDRVFDTYAELLPEAAELGGERFPQQPATATSSTARRSGPRPSTRSAGLLPAASLSNIGIYGTGQSYEQLLLRMRAHPLPEARFYADMMLTELRKVIPSFLQRVDVSERGGEWSAYLASTRDQTRGSSSACGPSPAGASATERMRRGDREVTLLDFDPDGEEKVLAAICFARARCSERRGAAAGAALGHDERVCPPCTRTWATGKNRRHRPAGPSSGPTTASSSSPTTAPSATSSGTACSPSSGSRLGIRARLRHARPRGRGGPRRALRRCHRARRRALYRR